jgi:large subunit ribosomal protein L30
MSDDKRDKRGKTEKMKAVDVDALLTEVTGAIATGKPAKKAKAEAAPPTAAQPKAARAAAAAVPAPAPAKETRTVCIRQVRSGICAPIDQKQTLFGLGLRRIRQEVVRPDTAGVRGQIHKVRHLVEVVGE